MDDGVEIGQLGYAQQVPEERLKSCLTGDQVATLGYWWIKMNNAPVLSAELDDSNNVTNLKVFIPEKTEDKMDTFSLGVITLADIPGVPPANKSFPWMTHELVVHTLDKTHPVNFADDLPWITMSPHNLSVQFQVNDDSQAVNVAYLMVKAIVNGILPAEIQALISNKNKMMTVLSLYNLWQDTVRITAEHERTGGTHQEEVDQN